MELPKDDPNNVYKSLLNISSRKPEGPQSILPSDEVLLRLTIDLGNSVKDTILVKHGDNLEELANDFCERNGLDEESYRFVLKNIESNYQIAISQGKNQSNFDQSESRTRNSQNSRFEASQNRSTSQRKGLRDHSQKQSKHSDLRQESRSKSKREEERSWDFNVYAESSGGSKIKRRRQGASNIHERLYNEAKERREKTNLSISRMREKSRESNQGRKSRGNSVDAGKRLYERGMRAKILRT